jgi:S-methylmethionine-dependent homocysteine/selenocysteine methylase
MASRKAVKLLDGGMGHLLRRMGVRIEGEIGSQRRFLGVALANTEQPNLVRDAHLAYIDAGSDVITTNNYAIVPATLELCDEKEYDLDELIVESALRAKEAVQARPGCGVQVAGSLPPLKASYRADLVGKIDDLI